MPHQERGEHRRDGVRQQHEGTGCGRGRRGAEQAQIDVVGMPESGGGAGPARGAEDLEDDVERALSDEHGQCDTSP